MIRADPIGSERPACPIDWDDLDRFKFQDEARAVADLLARVPLDAGQRVAVVGEAAALVEAARGAANRQGTVESFLQQFSLATQEGLALMCLAEALLRTPDPQTRDRLIAEKIGSADWAAHLGQSESLFVNVSTLGLLLTGKLVDVEAEARRDFAGYLRRLAARLGEPVIRKAVDAAIRMMGEQFVLAPTIDAGLRRARAKGQLCSFDMLGEGARTDADARRFLELYAAAIEAVGQSHGSDPEAAHGVSVKLSALFARFEAVNEARVFDILYPRLKRLAVLAAKRGLNLTIDAEEADRLVISLKLLARLAFEPELDGWKGLGIVVQAYQKRALPVIERLGQLARQSGRRLMVRLVKGAYWDSEIKRAQVGGLPGYPVFTTKAATDLSYLVCARALIDAGPALYPQFATHNAHTISSVRAIARARGGADFEFQRLHGMGEALYAAAERAAGPHRLRVYAPIGGHEDLLPYLVRRLLENGANTSFVNALLDPQVPAVKVVEDPIGLVERAPGPHPRIPLPADLFGPARRNSQGLDLSMRDVRNELARANPPAAKTGESAVLSPVDGAEVGCFTPAGPAAIEAAATAAVSAWRKWDSMGGRGRAAILRAMGDILQANMPPLVALLGREAGKTLPDSIAEVREAVDFCRYYASLAEQRFSGFETLSGPVGETNQLELRGRGVFACISPWNFPLAIFTGQVAAALAAGNAVLAKPAEQTPLIAAEAVRLFREAGLPSEVLHLLPGDGGVGACLVSHPLVAGVAFTGGTETGWTINRSLAERPGPIIPLIAETGGLNAMFVDTTALHEQVVDDVIQSAFGSAGQRCSALRILFVPNETADDLIAKIAGAMDELQIGDPSDPATDVGPVIDGEARQRLHAHLDHLAGHAKVIKVVHGVGLAGSGSYFPPVLAEIPGPDFLLREVFGPILHVVRYNRSEIAEMAERLARLGYGLTLGVHSRIASFVDEVRALVPAGNCYVNRSIIGAVVGVQPFGGEGLSGTGPKAGGPNALSRYAVERALSINVMAQGGDPALLNLD